MSENILGMDRYFYSIVSPCNSRFIVSLGTSARHPFSVTDSFYDFSNANNVF